MADDYPILRSLSGKRRIKQVWQALDIDLIKGDFSLWQHVPLLPPLYSTMYYVGLVGSCNSAIRLRTAAMWGGHGPFTY